MKHCLPVDLHWIDIILHSLNICLNLHIKSFIKLLLRSWVSLRVECYSIRYLLWLTQIWRWLHHNLLLVSHLIEKLINDFFIGWWLRCIVVICSLWVIFTAFIDLLLLLYLITILLNGWVVLGGLKVWFLIVSNLLLRRLRRSHIILSILVILLRVLMNLRLGINLHFGWCALEGLIIVLLWLVICLLFLDLRLLLRWVYTWVWTLNHSSWRCHNY